MGSRRTKASLASCRRRPHVRGPPLDYTEWIGIKGLLTTPITDKPRKLNKSSDPDARYWGARGQMGRGKEAPTRDGPSDSAQPRTVGRGPI